MIWNSKLLDWLLLIAAIAVSVFIVLCKPVSAGTARYTVTVESSAVSASRYAVVVEPQAASKAEKRQIVRAYWATWCAPCITSKAEIKAAIKAGLLPFDMDFIDVSNGGAPSWCDQIPAYGWEVNGQTRYVIGYPGVTKLVTRWEASFKPAPKAMASSYTPRWTWSAGSLQQHLQSAHGIQNANRLSQDDAARGHDLMHDYLERGYSQTQINNYARRRGLLP